MNFGQRLLTISVTIVLLAYPVAELLALVLARAVRSDVAPLVDPALLADAQFFGGGRILLAELPRTLASAMIFSTILTWGGLIVAAVSFTLAMWRYSRANKLTQGFTNRLSGVGLGLVFTGFGLLIEDIAEDNIAEHFGVTEQWNQLDSFDGLLVTLLLLAFYMTLATSSLVQRSVTAEDTVARLS